MFTNYIFSDGGEQIQLKGGIRDMKHAFSLNMQHTYACI